MLRLNFPIRSIPQKTRYWLKAFLLGRRFLPVFIPFIVYDQGYFLYYGDFNVQQVPFYQMAHDAIRREDIFWNWNTDLGANFIGSYSFLSAGQSLFLADPPFPSQAVPYLMGPLLILKFGCAALTGYVYLQRYAKNKDFAVLGGMLYAFSGFSVYNIFFNHFHEAIVFFPLLLALGGRIHGHQAARSVRRGRIRKLLCQLLFLCGTGGLHSSSTGLCACLCAAGESPCRSFMVPL